MITIVIPIHNREKYIKRTLDSIAASDFRPVKLILVNNGSTDRSMDICQEFQLEHMDSDFSIYITEEHTPGANHARNKGLLRCQSKYVYFFDDDDEFSPDFLSTFNSVLNNLLNQHKVPDMICLNTNMDVQGKMVIRDYHIPGSDAVCNQILAGVLSTPSVIYRTDFLREIGGWNSKISAWQDWELGIRALLHNPRLYWYRARAFHTIYVHQASITGNNITRNYKDSFNTISEVRKLLDTYKKEIPAGSRWYIKPDIRRARKALKYRRWILWLKVHNLCPRGAWRIAMKTV